MGDRVQATPEAGATALAAMELAAVRLFPGYLIGPGDMIIVRVRGDVDLNYKQNIKPAASAVEAAVGLQPQVIPDIYQVMPDGTIHLPLLGPVEASGRTVEELRQLVTDELSAYFKQFTVDLSVSRPGLVKVWVSGQVVSPGPQVLPSTATVLEVLLRAGIQPSGSTRRVELRRVGKTRKIDVYSIAAYGELESNVLLESGDEIHVPMVSEWVAVDGEVCRPGRFEMVSRKEKTDPAFRSSDLMDLCQGLLPTGAPSHAIIERLSSSEDMTAIHVDLSGKDDPELRPGDRIIIPSVADYQPTIRLVGEFKGENVYQRVAGAVLNKSGVYRLAKGETASDVIVRTGGTTPQADLKRAKIERRVNGKVETIPLNLEDVLTRKDESADVVLQSGDTIVLPALLDKVYVFGQVVRSGGFSYEPDRRMLDYLAYAGGPGGRAKSSALVVRGNPDEPEVLKVNLTEGMKGEGKDNPVMQPGDVIYVPQGVVTDWRDISQIISTVRLLTLF